MKRPDEKLLTVVLRPDEMEQLKQYCHENHISLSAYVRFCLKAGYNRGFDFADRVIDQAESPSTAAAKST